MMKSVLLCFCFVLQIFATRMEYKSHQVWRVIPQTQYQMDVLAELQIHHQKYQLDFWKEPSAVHHPVVIRVPPGMQDEMRLRLSLCGLEPEITIPNLQTLIENETRLNTPATKPTSLADFDYSKYHPLEEVNDWIQQLAAAYPDRVSVFNISHSYEKRTILALKITGKKTTNSKPGFFFNGGIHSREWISPATVIYMTAQLIEKYESDPLITDLVDAMDWYVVPVFNVDGYVYTWTKDRMWRKTRSKHFPCIGVDPNRNWDYEWCKNGASKDPCSDTYCGPSPFSEVEVKGVASFLNSVPGRFKAYIDFHSFSQLWMTPWGYTRDLPQDYGIQDNSSAHAVKALEAVHGTKYVHGNIARVIYTASGSSADWTYGTADIKFSAGVELRDQGKYGFVLPADQIIPSGEETLQGVLAMAQFVLNNS